MAGLSALDSTHFVKSLYIANALFGSSAGVVCSKAVTNAREATHQFFHHQLIFGKLQTIGRD